MELGYFHREVACHPPHASLDVVSSSPPMSVEIPWLARLPEYCYPALTGWRDSLHQNEQSLQLQEALAKNFFFFWGGGILMQEKANTDCNAFILL